MKMNEELKKLANTSECTVMSIRFLYCLLSFNLGHVLLKIHDKVILLQGEWNTMLSSITQDLTKPECINLMTIPEPFKMHLVSG